jgi:serine/threonine protein kinase
MIGKTISNYKIQSVIGSGGMGKVYLARQLTIDREVAIKILDPSLSENFQFRERFINEANALAKLNHPNIVSIYDFVEFEGNYCIIMEYVNGATLDKIIENNDNIDISLSINIINQLLDGLSYAHKQSIVHRDIKPSNVIIDPDKRVKILDFGIAKMVLSNSNLTKTGTRMGSICYMSPEQILGKELDLKTDIYSTGITFYELLSRQLPYEINTESDYIVQSKIVNEVLPDIRTSNPIVPQNIADAINISTQKNPDDRFNDCDEFKKYILNVEKISKPKNKKPSPQPTHTVYIPPINIDKESKHKSVSKGLIFGVVFLVLLIFSGVIYYNNADKNINSETLSQNSGNSLNDGINTRQDNKKQNFTKEQTNKSQELINAWINDINNKNIDFQKYYSERVSYYKFGNVSLSKIIKDKNEFFDKWDNIEMSADQFSSNVISNDEIVVTFDKYFNVDNYSNNRNYNGKVKSRLVLKNIDGVLKIISESDDRAYYTNKNF